MDENEEVYIEDRYEVLIGELIEKIRTLEPGTEQHEKACKALAEIYSVRIKYTDIEMGYEDHVAQRKHEMIIANNELATKQEQFDEQRREHMRDLIINTAVALTGIVVPLAAYGVWMNRGFKFEETGTYTSSTFKNLFRVFKPNKIG